MCSSLKNRKFEFLDHTADVQIKSWGGNLKEAFENAAIAMTAYITDIDKVEIKSTETVSVEATDLLGLLYRYLDEVLFLFNADPFLLTKEVRISSFTRDGIELTPGFIHNTDDEASYKLEATCYGEAFSMGRHPQGTEIKAITYSNMQVYDEAGKHETLFIVDI